jgi:cytochrome c oxidase assembly protein subunit 15
VTRFRLSPDAYRRVTLLALLSLAAIVVTGAAVRLTGSGLGCSDWPTCEQGQLAPAEMSDAPAMIEFVNRTITGLVSVAAAVAVLGSLVRVPRRRDLTLLSWGLVGGVVAQILIGAMVVLLHLSPKTVIAHFLVSMVIVANAVVLHHRAGRPDGTAELVVPGRMASLGRALVAAAAVVVVTGTVVTANGPHAGDEQAERWTLGIEAAARVHGVAVVVFLAVVLVALRWTRAASAPAPVQRAASVLLAVVVAQAGVGYAQYFTGVPALLVGIHVVGALAVWVAAVRFQLVLSQVPAGVRAPEAPLVAA